MDELYQVIGRRKQLIQCSCGENALNKRKSRLVAVIAAAMATTAICSVSSVPVVADSGVDPRADVTAAGAASLGLKMPVKIRAGSEEGLYIVKFVEEAAPTYEGGISGLPATAPQGDREFDIDSAPVRRYIEHLTKGQDAFLRRAGDRIDRALQPEFRYQYALNGVAVRLTGDEALAVAADPAVLTIIPDFERELHTDVGPQWIGADEMWDATADLGLPADYQGEGMVIGVIDTGISPTNPSFADPAPGGGYDHPSIRSGARYGICNPSTTPNEFIAYDAAFPCNDKLIGAYVYNVGADLPAGQSWDYDGHGSHTASTAGGNVVPDVQILGTDFDISGVAPRAHVIAYLGCCSGTGLLASIEQAIVDDVDVINYSIGSSAATGGWDEFDAAAFLNARAAGVFVAVSNGNDGPGLYTGGSPADVPWVTSVGNQTHTRYNGNRLIDMVGGDTPPPGDILGKGATGALGLTDIIYAGDFGDPTCVHLATGQALPPDGEGDPSGNVVLDHPEFEDKIVVCDRGGNGRVQKSRNVAAHGAVGFVLANDPGNGNSLTGDEYVIPGVMIGNADSVVLKAWLDTGSDHQAAIEGFEFQFGPQYADFIAAGSSRGPNRFVDVLNPSVTAPGTDILAALVDPDADGPGEYGGTEYGMISGTSMASPHVAGAAALILQAHPTWTPAQVQSALMTTASPTVQHHNGGDGVNPSPAVATPDVQGSGRVQVGQAALAGLLFNETEANYRAADPQLGGDPKTLNLPSFMNSQCLAECSWTRTATVPSDGIVPPGVEWSASIDANSTDDDLDLTVTLNGGATATLSPGNTLTIAVTANVEGAADGVNLYGRITLTPNDPNVPTVTMPVLVVPSSVVLPGTYEVETRRNTGSIEIGPIQSREVTDLAGATAWVVPDVTEATLVQGATDEPYDNLADVDIYEVEIPVGTASAEFEITDTTMVDLDMYVGLGGAEDASEATEVEISATGSALEHVQLTNPEPGTYWVLIQNWEGSTPTAADPYTLNMALVPSTDNGTGELVAPDGTLATGEEYSVTATWNLPDLAEGDIVYGAVTLGTPPGDPDHIGTQPLRLTRLADDVTKEASVAAANPGDEVDYEITIQPNVTPADLTYTIVDTVPAGLTIDAGTVTGDLDGVPITGVVAGQTITWEVTMPSPFLGEYSYVASTPADNPACAAVSGYLDLDALGIDFDPGFDGDSDYLTYAPVVGPMPFYGDDITTFVIGEDGYVATLAGFDDGGDAPYSPQALPDPEAPNGVIAPLWTDMQTDIDNGSGIRIAESSGAGAWVVEWDNVFDWDDTAATPLGTLQLWMYNTVDAVYPEMTFEYDGLSATQLADLIEGAATVGVEDDAGENATVVVDQDDPFATLDEAGTICLDYLGPEFPPATLSYSVTVDEGTWEPGDIVTNTVSHVTDNYGDEPAEATADFQIGAPVIEFAPTQTFFGQHAVGATSPAQLVTLSNVGDGDLEVTGASAPDGFSIDATDCSAAAVPPGGSCDLSVTFTPEMLGLVLSQVTVESNAGTTANTATLAGVGIAPGLSVSPVDGAQFGDVLVGTTAQETVSVVNSSSAPLTIESMTTEPPFTLVSETCTAAPVAAFSACQVTVEFAPTELGPVTGGLSVESDAVGAPHTIVLAGTGTAADAIIATDPARYWDTRAGQTTADGQLSGTGRLSAEATFPVQIAGRGDVPADAVGVVANLTVITPDGPGYATLFPCGGAVPVASHLNYVAGDVWANNAVVPLNDAGQVCVFTKAGADYALDVNGFVPAGSQLVGLTPTRFLDTRTTGSAVPAEGVVEVQIAGVGDVPADAAAAIVNVTAVTPGGPGYATVYPCTAERPNASTLNYFAGQVVPNGAIADLSDDGSICVFTKAASDILVDVAGYLPPDAEGLTAVSPERLYDSRAGSTTIDGVNAGDPGRLAAEGIVEIQVAGRGSVPADATAALFNVAVVLPDGPGYLTLFPCGERPTASNLNHSTGGALRANNALTALSDDGTVCVFAKSATDVVLDLTGWLD